ncbi:unnamed protein product, partial [Linum tenue]
TRSRCAVVTGANRGLGFAICRQLAASGVVVVLTARDENRGIQAVDDLKSNHGVSPDNIVYHQLDVTDSSSIASLADFIKTQFGKLDILVGTTPNSTSSVTTPFDYQLIWFWSHSLNAALCTGEQCFLYWMHSKRSYRHIDAHRPGKCPKVETMSVIFSGFRLEIE